MTTYKVWLNHSPKKDGSHTLMIRITKDRKHKYLSTGHSIKKGEFNPDANSDDPTWMQGNRTDKKRINNDIKLLIEKLKREEGAGKQSVNKKQQGFFEYAENKAQDYMLEMSVGTAKHYISTLKKFKEFTGKEIQFKGIDIDLLKKFRLFLLAKGNGKATVYNNMSRIRALFETAREEDVISDSLNPFLKFKFDKPESKGKVKLSPIQIKAIHELKMPKNSLILHTRDAFLFMMYAGGLRIRDLLLLKWENIQNGRLVYTMSKTGKTINVKLIPQALDILSKYQGEGFIFPLMRNDREYNDKNYLHTQISSKTALFNKNLKMIGEKAEIDSHLSTHVARHSFADLSRKMGADLHSLQGLLGHSSLKITEAYLESLDTEAGDLALEETFKNF